MLSLCVNPTLHPRRGTSGNADILIGGFSSFPPSPISNFRFPASPPSVSPISTFCFPVSAFSFFLHYPLLTTHYPPSFHTLPHSFALAFLLKRLESSNSELFAQNTRGGGTPSRAFPLGGEQRTYAFSILRTLFQVPYPITPLFLTLTKTPGCVGILPNLEPADHFPLRPLSVVTSLLPYFLTSLLPYFLISLFPYLLTSLFRYFLFFKPGPPPLPPSG